MSMMRGIISAETKALAMKLINIANSVIVCFYFAVRTIASRQSIKVVIAAVGW